MINLARPSTIVIVRHGQYFWNLAYNRDFQYANLDEIPKEIIGVEDQHVPLTSFGREQALLTDKALAKEYPEGFDAIFYSPWDRAVETLKLFLEGWTGEVEVNGKIIELDKYRIKMMSRSHQSMKLVEQYQGDGVLYLDKDKPETWFEQFEILRRLLADKHCKFEMFRRRGISKNGEMNTTMTGESAWDVSIRTGDFLRRLFQKHYHEKLILVITHLATKLWLRGNLLELSPKQTISDLIERKIAMSPAGVSRFDFARDASDAPDKPRDRWQCVYWNRVFYEGDIKE